MMIYKLFVPLHIRFGDVKHVLPVHSQIRAGGTSVKNGPCKIVVWPILGVAVSKSSQLLQWMQSHYVAVTCAHKAQLPTNEANSPACAVGQTDVHGGKKNGAVKVDCAAHRCF